MCHVRQASGQTQGCGNLKTSRVCRSHSIVVWTIIIIILDCKWLTCSYSEFSFSLHTAERMMKRLVATLLLGVMLKAAILCSSGTFDIY